MQKALNDINIYENKYGAICSETKMASVKNLMPQELFAKEFRRRRFKDFEEMLDSTKIFLADRLVNPVRVQQQISKDSNKMDVDELIKNIDAFYSNFKGGKSKGKGKNGQWQKGGNAWSSYPANGWSPYPAKGMPKGDQSKGSFKGDGKGDGKGSKGKGKGKGPCWTCGDPDHQQRNWHKGQMVWNQNKWIYEMMPYDQQEGEQKEESEQIEQQDP